MAWFESSDSVKKYLRRDGRFDQENEVELFDGDHQKFFEFTSPDFSNCQVYTTIDSKLNGMPMDSGADYLNRELAQKPYQTRYRGTTVIRNIPCE